MQYFILLSLLLSTLTVQACQDNILWIDSYEWTCRDYDRVPQECNSKWAVSAKGISVFDACCVCRANVERRRNFATCLNSCSAEEDQCNAECTATNAGCVDECTDEWDSSEDPGNIRTPSPVASPPNGSSSELALWVIILLAVGGVVLLCFLCLFILFFCMPKAEESCQDDIQERPMLIDNGCEMPCSTLEESCSGARRVAYSPIEQYSVNQI